jgi:leucine efflux protein
MENIDWLGFLPAAIAVILSPGPGSIFVAKSAASDGIRAGRHAMLGIMLGDTMLIILSLLGVSAIFAAYPSLFYATRLLGAGYLIYIGVRSFFATPQNSADNVRSVQPFKKAFTITLLNPKAILFFMAFFPVFINYGGQGFHFSFFTIAIVFMIISGTYLFVLSHVSAKIGSAFNENYLLQSIAHKIGGFLFIGFGIKVAINSK